MLSFVFCTETVEVNYGVWENELFSVKVDSGSGINASKWSYVRYRYLDTY